MAIILCYRKLYICTLLCWENLTALKPLHNAAINCANKCFAAVNNIKFPINKQQSKFSGTIESAHYNICMCI